VCASAAGRQPTHGRGPASRQQQHSSKPLHQPFLPLSLSNSD
jgi:hypothetical protein